jgi:hypothetical protein
MNRVFLSCSENLCLSPFISGELTTSLNKRSRKVPINQVPVTFAYAIKQMPIASLTQTLYNETRIPAFAICGIAFGLAFGRGKQGV